MRMKKLLLFLIIQIISFAAQSQNYSVKSDSFGFVILYEDNTAIDLILNTPSMVTQYKVVNRNHVCFLMESGLLTFYDNWMKKDGSWKEMKSSSGWMENQITRTSLRFILHDLDKLEKFENNKSVGFVDFEKIIKENIAEENRKLEFMKNWKKDNKKN